MPFDNSFRVSPGQCTCGEVLDMATAVRHDCTPKPGDFTVCIGCLHVARFGEKLELVPLSREDLGDMDEGVRADLFLAIRGLLIARMQRGAADTSECVPCALWWYPTIFGPHVGEPCNRCGKPCTRPANAGSKRKTRRPRHPRGQA